MKQSPRMFRVWRGYIHFLILLGFAGLVVRCGWLQLYQHKFWVAYGEKMESRVVPIQANRGMILDRYGRGLAIGVRAPVVTINPRMVPADSRAETAETLARILKLDKSKVEETLEKDKAFAYVKRKATKEEADAVNAEDIRGIDIRDETGRAYPGGSMLCHVLGYVGIDNFGLGGLEASYEPVLKGTDGEEEVKLDGLGRRIGDTKPIRSAIDGRSLVLTIDARIQGVAEEELAAACDKYKPESACIVVMDPWRGDVLAMACWPAFDPAEYARAPETVRRNMAVAECFEPGSSFKPFVASIALEKGRVTPDTMFDCHNGSYRIGSRTLHDAHGYGMLSVRDVIAYSSNIGMAQVGARLTPDEMYQGLKSFGFGSAPGSGLSGESSGLLHPPAQWSKLTISSIPMGQEVAVSPLQLAAGFCVFANGGWYVPPRMIAGTADADGKNFVPQQPASAPRKVLSDRVAYLMCRDLLAKVVEYGTANAVAIDGYAMSGKTGTAQAARDDARGYEPGAFNSVFVGIVPTEAPKYVIAMIAHKPSGAHYGGVVSAPPVSHVAERLLSADRVPRVLAINTDTGRKPRGH